MPLIRKADAPTFTTPNAVMVTHAGPSLGSACEHVAGTDGACRRRASAPDRP